MSVLDDYPFLRNVSSPLTGKMLSALDERCRVVQFDAPLADGDYRLLAGFLRDYPRVSLRVYGGTNPMQDLDFLRFFPDIRSFQADLWNLRSFEGLEYLSGRLAYLGLGATKSKALALDVLRRFTRLEELYLEGHIRGIETIGGLVSLKKLTLRSVTLPDLSILKPLVNLWSLDIKLGGTRDLSLLPEIGCLKYLEIWMIKGLSDLSAISDTVSLQYLFLQALRNVTSLPVMNKLTVLRRLHLETMKGLRNLEPLLDAPALEELNVLDGGHMNVEDFRCLRNHSSLKSFSAGLGSFRKNREVKALVALPETASLKNGFEFR